MGRSNGKVGGVGTRKGVGRGGEGREGAGGGSAQTPSKENYQSIGLTCATKNKHTMEEHHGYKMSLLFHGPKYLDKSFEDPCTVVVARGCCTS